MATFGHNPATQGATGENISADYVIAFGPYALPVAAAINSISLYLDNAPGGGNQTFRCGMYLDSAGSPTTLVATTNARTFDTGGGWGGNGYYDFTFAADPSLAAASYWLAFQMTINSGGTVNYKYDAGAATARTYKARAYASSFQDPFGTPDGRDTHEASMYATYTATGSAAPTPLAPTHRARPRSMSPVWAVSTTSPRPAPSRTVSRLVQTPLTTAPPAADTSLTRAIEIRLVVYDRWNAQYVATP
jgi:hypothetical protein